jgi:hypothetical protein
MMKPNTYVILHNCKIEMFRGSMRVVLKQPLGKIEAAAGESFEPLVSKGPGAQLAFPCLLSPVPLAWLYSACRMLCGGQPIHMLAPHSHARCTLFMHFPLCHSHRWTTTSHLWNTSWCKCLFLGRRWRQQIPRRKLLRDRQYERAVLREGLPRVLHSAFASFFLLCYAALLFSITLKT